MYPEPLSLSPPKVMCSPALHEGPSGGGSVGCCVAFTRRLTLRRVHDGRLLVRSLSRCSSGLVCTQVVRQQKKVRAISRTGFAKRKVVTPRCHDQGMDSNILHEAVALLEKANANLEPELMTADAARALPAEYARA